jgi:hypothetical protein
MNSEAFVIPILPHVKRYMATLAPVHSPLLIQNDSLLGHLFKPLLIDEQITAEHNGLYRDRLTQTITVSFCKDLTKLNPQLFKLIKINVVMDSVIKSVLLNWIYAMGKAGIPPYTACRYFIEHYRIDDDKWGLDAAYKYYQRATKNKTFPSYFKYGIE